MDTAFVIGNGESRTIFPIEELKGKGVVWGCNAIYRDHPELPDHVVAVNPPMYEELVHAKENINERNMSRYGKMLCDFKIWGIDDIPEWNYICENDHINELPKNLKLYRIWRGGDVRKGTMRTIDFTENRGSGTSAVLLAAESGIENVCILAFDILGARQWEFTGVREGELSRKQNNIYKNTNNYPTRLNMKAYLKYEWLFQLRQIFKKHPDTKFHFFNRREYIVANHFLRGYFDQPNIKVGTYGDLKRWIDGERDKIEWFRL